MVERARTEARGDGRGKHGGGLASASAASMLRPSPAGVLHRLAPGALRVAQAQLDRVRARGEEPAPHLPRDLVAVTGTPRGAKRARPRVSGSPSTSSITSLNLGHVMPSSPSNCQ